MPKNSVDDWSTTAADNTDIASIDIAENCPAANMNNAWREGMAQIKTKFDTMQASIHIATINVSGGTLTWEEDIPSTFKSVHLVIHEFLPTTTNTGVQLRVGQNGSAGAFTSTNTYANQQATTAGTTATLSAGSSTQVNLMTSVNKVDSATRGAGAFTVTGFNDASSSLTVMGSSSGTDSSNVEVTETIKGRNATALNNNAIQLISNGGFATLKGVLIGIPTS